MLSFKSLVPASLLALGAQAYISSIQIPAQATVGGQLDVTAITSNYIQNWDDYSVLFSAATVPLQAPFIGIGSILTNVDLLSRDKSRTGGGSFEISLFLDPAKIQPNTQYQLNAVVTSVVGASFDVITSFYNATFHT